MIKIMFVCHGNICRSPMAEFVLKDMVGKKGIEKEFVIASAATSREEIGNPVHHGTREKLREFGITVEGKHAVQLTKEDGVFYDYIIGMDERNITNITRIIGESNKDKVHRLLDFTDRPGDIADPWYTNNFDKTYEDVYEGCQALLLLMIQSIR